MTAYRAVLFDWMLTLADYPPPAAMARRAARLVGRSLTDGEVTSVVDALTRTHRDPDVVEAMTRCDCSVAEHEHAEMMLLRRAGLDEELAAAWYSLLGDPDVHRLYAEVPSVLSALAARRVHVVVISDIHVDLREHARRAGIDALIDGWVLSFEHGVQKPDPRIYELALAAAGVAPTDALMVGDRHTADGAASLLGIDSLILPPRRARDPEVVDPRLNGVVRLVG
ncbi:MAG: HAD family hydrolase [Acidimicrobiales bacterium]